MKPGALNLPSRLLILVVLLSMYLAHPLLGWSALSAVVVFGFMMSRSRRAVSIVSLSEN